MVHGFVYEFLLRKVIVAVELAGIDLGLFSTFSRMMFCKVARGIDTDPGWNWIGIDVALADYERLSVGKVQAFRWSEIAGFERAVA
jgi:hypothetical protein